MLRRIWLNTLMSLIYLVDAKWSLAYVGRSYQLRDISLQEYTEIFKEIHLFRTVLTPSK